MIARTFTFAYTVSLLLVSSAHAEMLEISTRKKCLYLRSAPRTGTGLTCLEKGTPVEATGERRGSWVEVRHEGQTGWVFDGGDKYSYLRPVGRGAATLPDPEEVPPAEERPALGDDAETMTITTPDGCLNFRVSPDPDARSMECVKDGIEVTLTGERQGDWAQVVRNGETGWMRTQLRGRAYLVENQSVERTEAGTCESGTCPDATRVEPDPAEKNVGDLVEVADKIQGSTDDSSTEGLFEQLAKFPSGCKYHFVKPPFTGSDFEAFCENIDKGGIPSCAPSNCVTATWLALIIKLKAAGKWERHKDDFGCTPPVSMGKAYGRFISSNGIPKTFEEFDLGPSRQINRSDLLAQETNGWPVKGDVVLVQRGRKQGGTAHAVIFSHYKKSGGQIEEICYWSSNVKTKGFGQQCEKIGRVAFLQVGKIQ